MKVLNAFCLVSMERNPAHFTAHSLASYLNEVHKLTYMNIKIDRGRYPLQNVHTDDFFLCAVSTMRHFIRIQTDFSDFSSWSGSKTLSLCLLILCQTLFVWFQVFSKGIKPYVGVVSEVAGFTDGRRTLGSSAWTLLLFPGWQWSLSCYHVRARNSAWKHTKPYRRLVRKHRCASPEHTYILR